MQMFVSGTVTDMDLARDALNKQVRPRLSQKVLEKYGQEIGFTDLRTGGDTENADNGAVRAALACLEAIDEAAPPTPMVVLLGGHCSRPLEDETVALAQREFHFTVKHTPCSITELEIEYGALRDEACLKRTVFCYIDREDEKPDEAMRLLRRRLGKSVPKEQILRFIQTDDAILSEEEFYPFDRVLADALWQLIDGKIEPTDEEKQEELLHRSYMEKKAAGFRGRRALLARGRQLVEAHVPVLLLTGETGAGKSSLLSRLLCELEGGESPCAVLPIYCGLTEKVDSGMEVLERIVRYLEGVLGRTRFEPKSFDAWKDYVEILCMQYEKADLPRLVIGIDAVDRLRDSNVAQEMLFLPFGSYERVQFVVSFTPDITVPRRLSRAPVITLMPMEEQETREIIRDILSEYNKRELAPSVEDRLVELTRDTLPLRLNLIVQALRLMDATAFGAAHKNASMEDVNAAQNQIIDRFKRLDLLSLCREFLKFACECIDERLYESLRHIAAAPYGLTSELLATLAPDTFHLESFLLLRHYLQEVFIRRADGRYGFEHKYFRQALFFVNLNCKPDDPALSRRMFDVLYNLKDNHPIRTSDILYFARQCQYLNFSIDYILNAFTKDKLEHRREPILRMMKDWQYCTLLVENLPTHFARVFEQKGSLVDVLPKAVERLMRYLAVFGDLFARGEDDRREETAARERLYRKLLVTVDKLAASIEPKLMRNREELELTVMPYVAWQCEWFRACAVYDRLNGEQRLFEPRTPMPDSNLSGRGIRDDFFAPLGEQQTKEYHAMTREAFSRRFFVHPNRVFREAFRYWLSMDCEADLGRLFGQPEEAEKCFIRVYEVVAEDLFRRSDFDINAMHEERYRYRQVFRKARKYQCKMVMWSGLYSRVRQRNGPPPSVDGDDVYQTFARRYRDLDHQESTLKYANFLRYTVGALKALVDKPEEAIACSRDAVTAAERAIRFSVGRSDCVEYYFTFCADLRERLETTKTATCLAEIEEVYERQFAFLLGGEFALPPSTYGDLMDLAYPQTMQALYAAAKLSPARERQTAWHRRAFGVADKLLEVADDDVYLSDVRRLYHKKEWQTKKYRILESHDRLLTTVLVAVEALVGLNGTVDGFDGSDEAANCYDYLEENVLTNFPHGSFRYPDSELRARIVALMKKRAYPQFSALLKRLHGYLKPTPADGLYSSADSDEMIE